MKDLQESELQELLKPMSEGEIKREAEFWKIEANFDQIFFRRFAPIYVFVLVMLLVVDSFIPFSPIVKGIVFMYSPLIVILIAANITRKYVKQRKTSVKN